MDNNHKNKSQVSDHDLKGAKKLIILLICVVALGLAWDNSSFRNTVTHSGTHISQMTHNIKHHFTVEKRNRKRAEKKAQQAKIKRHKAEQRRSRSNDTTVQASSKHKITLHKNQIIKTFTYHGSNMNAQPLRNHVSNYLHSIKNRNDYIVKGSNIHCSPDNSDLYSNINFYSQSIVLSKKSNQ